MEIGPAGLLASLAVTAGAGFFFGARWRPGWGRNRSSTPAAAAFPFLQHVIEPLKSCVIVFEEGGNVVSLNPAAERLLGTPASQVLGQPVDTVVNLWAGDNEPTAIDVQTLLTVETEDPAHRWTLSTAQGPIPVELEIYPFPFEDNRYGILILKDASSIRESRRALEESNRRLQHIAHHLRDVLWLISRDTGRLEFISSSCVQLFSLTPEQLQENPWMWLEVVHPDDRDRVEKAFHLSGGKEVDVEYRVVTSDPPRWIRDRAYVVQDGDRVVRFSMDVTERLAHRRQLEESQAQLSMAMQASRMGFFVVNLREHSVVWSRELAELLGANPGTLPGHSIEELYRWVPPAYRDPLRNGINRALEEHRSFETEFRVPDPSGGERWLLTRGQPFFDPNGEPIHLAGLLLDVTHERRTQKRIEDLVQELANANRQLAQKSSHLEDLVEKRSRFFSRMSHELRTPLNAICGFVELLLEERAGPLTEKQRRYVNNVHSSGQHLLRVVTDVLDLSRIEAGRLKLQPELLNAGEALREVADTLSPLARKQQLDVLVDAEGEVVAFADPLRLRQILYNLVSNAIKFTPSGGSVTVHAANRPGGCVFTVIDTGIGITQDEAAKIFEEFEQLKPSTLHGQTGSGLGLTITKHLVELHGGQIHVESEPGQGSRFVVRLPGRERQAAQG